MTPAAETRAITVEHDKDHGWAKRTGRARRRLQSWTVFRGKRRIGAVLLQRNGRLQAFCPNPPYYAWWVCTVAAGVEWITRRARS